jgi:hypothetical protein
MMRWISDSVITSMKGLTKHADSPAPTNGEADATTASAPDTFIVLKKNHAKFLMTHCMIPKWYSTCMEALKKMMVENYNIWG